MTRSPGGQALLRTGRLGLYLDQGALARCGVLTHDELEP